MSDEGEDGDGARRRQFGDLIRLLGRAGYAAAFPVTVRRLAEFDRELNAIGQLVRHEGYNMSVVLMEVERRRKDLGMEPLAAARSVRDDLSAARWEPPPDDGPGRPRTQV